MAQHRRRPAYLADSLRPTSEFVARRHLCSADTTTLLVPPARRVTLGDRAFPVAAARAIASTDQGRLVAVVFSAAAVVQLTSDYCHRFLNLICKVPLQLCEASL